MSTFHFYLNCANGTKSHKTSQYLQVISLAIQCKENYPN